MFCFTQFLISKEKMTIVSTFPKSVKILTIHLMIKISAVNVLGNCILLYQDENCRGDHMKVADTCDEGEKCCRDEGRITRLHGLPCFFGAVASSVRLCPEVTTTTTSTTTTTATTKRSSTNLSTTLFTTHTSMLPSTPSTEMSTTEGSVTSERTYLLLLAVVIGLNLIVIVTYCCVKRKRASLKMKKKEEQQMTHLIDLSIHENKMEKERQSLREHSSNKSKYEPVTRRS